MSVHRVVSGLAALMTASVLGTYAESARATIVPFDMVDVALFPGAATASIVVTTGQQIPGGFDNSAAGNEFHLSSLQFDFDGDYDPLAEDPSIFVDLRIRTATFVGGQIVFDGFQHTFPPATPNGSFVVTKGENSYLNMPFLEGEVIGDGLEEFVRSGIDPPPPENQTFSVGLDEAGAVRWFQEGIDNFVGFKLDTDDYGWIRVQFDSVASTLTFLDGAFDDSGAPIVAGDAGPIGDADFDADADVDGADYLAWQRGLGLSGTASHSDGDANGDFNVDAADLGFWRQQFGDAGAIGAAGSVPEPTTTTLTTSLAILAIRRRRT
jgi:hypothetical protein